MQRYAITTVANLLNMERCASCDRELAGHWNYCIYCGRPFVAATTRRSVAAHHPHGPARATAPVIAALRRRGSTFWITAGIAVLGLALIIYAALQIFGSRG